MALIAVLAAVAVPGSVGSQGPSPDLPIDATLFRGVDAASVDGTATVTPTLDPAYRSGGALSDTTVLSERDQRPVIAGRPDAAAVQPAAPLGTIVIPTWHFDNNISWYGPGFYGNRTACGVAMTESLVGVAHRTLPCGTKITFRNPANGRVVTMPVVDRGPYVDGRDWDLTGGACLKLGHCYTGTIYWKYA
jgi:rare lipoprotein A (RlpA)-like double-psi beta-barrel protein